MSTASSVRKAYVPPSTTANAAAAAPLNNTTASSTTRPAGNTTSNEAQQQQQQAAVGSTHPPVASTTTVTSTSSSASRPSLSVADTKLAFASATASLLLRKPPLPVSDRSHYKTFILSHGVFEIESRFVMKEMIGQGAYGIVCSALDLKKKTLVAVKKIENVFDHRSLAKRTLRELKIVRSLIHENILGIERVIRPHNAVFNNIYMVSELMETDLACVIRSPQELTEEHCQFFIYQVLRGLKFIHSANVIHRDLKPRNLLVNSNCDLKICDFGLARVDDPLHRERCTMSNYIATRWYRAPEGCILAELIGRKPIFPGRDSFHQITLICSILGTPVQTDANKGADAPVSKDKVSASTSPAVTDDYISNLPRKAKVPFRQLYPHASALACDLLDKLLVFEPEKRLTVEQALAHPYLEELHCEEDEPVCTNFDYADYYYEYLKTTKEDLRYLIHEEITKFYAEEQFDPSNPSAVAAANAAGLGTTAIKDALNSFASQMAGALPKGKKTRRKSI